MERVRLIRFPSLAPLSSRQPQPCWPATFRQGAHCEWIRSKPSGASNKSLDSIVLLYAPTTIVSAGRSHLRKLSVMDMCVDLDLEVDDARRNDWTINHAIGMIYS